MLIEYMTLEPVIFLRVFSFGEKGERVFLNSEEGRTFSPIKWRRIGM